MENRQTNLNFLLLGSVFSMIAIPMYHYDDMEVDQSQSNLTKISAMNDRTNLIAYKTKAALTDLLHKAISLSNAKSDLYGEIGDGDVKVLIYSLPSKLIMNTAKLFGDSLKGNVDENTLIDIITYTLYIHSVINSTDYRNIDQILNHIHKIMHHRHYAYNSADMIYDRLSISDISSMAHIKAIRIKNLINSIDKNKDDTDIEKAKYSIKDSIYDLMIYVSMVFLKLHRI
jgi:hypothetical protein